MAVDAQGHEVLCRVVYFGNSRHPGVADQLRVERQLSCGLLGITAGRGLPIHEAMAATEFTDGINVGNKLICVRQLPDYPILNILLRLGNANSIVPGKALEESLWR